MKRLALVSLGLVCVIAFGSAGSPGKGYPGGFSLAVNSGGSAPVVFTLRSPAPPGAPSAPGYLEDMDSPANTALGGFALNAIIQGLGQGGGNVAIGYAAARNTATGTGNVAVGVQAMETNIESSDNTAVGAYALQYSDYGLDDTAVGHYALRYNTNGKWNTAVGRSAGEAVLGNGWNIYLGAWVTGTAEDANTIRIGKPYEPGAEWPFPKGQNRTFIAGIVDKPFTAGEAPSVVGITAEGRLGTMSSDLLPKGDKGDPGEGLVSKSLLLLPAGVAPPTGYSYLGDTVLALTAAKGRASTIKISVYQKQ